MESAKKYVIGDGIRLNIIKNEKETRKGSEEVEFLLNLFAYMFDLSYKVVLGSRLISLSAFIIR